MHVTNTTTYILQILTAFANAFHALQPLKVPGFRLELELCSNCANSCLICSLMIIFSLNDICVYSFKPFVYFWYGNVDIAKFIKNSCLWKMGYG